MAENPQVSNPPAPSEQPANAPDSACEFEEEDGSRRPKHLEDYKKPCDYSSEHHHYLPVKHLLGPNRLENVKEKLELHPMKESICTFLEHVTEKELKKYIDSVVMVVANKKKYNKIRYSCGTSGTGFIVSHPPKCKYQNSLTVVTAYHVVAWNNGENIYSLIKDPDDIYILFHYDGEAQICGQENKPWIKSRVLRIQPYWSKNRADRSSDEMKLDYVMLEVEHPGGDPKTVFKEFIFEESSRIQDMPKLQKTPLVDQIILFGIGHPHGTEKCLSFGKLTSDVMKLFREWEEKEDGKETEKADFVTYTITSCHGFSGSPIMFALLNGNEVILCGLGFVSFLHFARHCGTSFQSIMPHVRKTITDK